MLPGSAVKGIVSTWACWEANQKVDGSFNSGNKFLPDRNLFDDGTESSSLPGLARRVLGDNSDNGSEAAGDLVFLGGFPKTVPDLELDIVNPHCDQNGEDKNNLTPNAFLTVPSGTEWRFALCLRPGLCPEALKSGLKSITAAARWLEECLTQVGIGAKGASGYGRFARTIPEYTKQLVLPAPQKASASLTMEEPMPREAIPAVTTIRPPARTEIYANVNVFRNAVLRLAENPGLWGDLQRQVENLKAPGNEQWLSDFKRHTGGNEFKRLRSQPWYPT